MALVPQDLSPEQFLLTLFVKLAVMAVLATMLARYHRFRHILIFERRGWVDRLVFTLALGVPLAAGVAFRVQLHYYAADLTLEGALLAGLIAGPYTGALVGLMVSLPAVLLTTVATGACSLASSSRSPLPSAAASPAAACVRRARRRKRSGGSRRS